MSHAKLTPDLVAQSLLFARMSLAAYDNKPAATVRGLARLKNELRFRDKRTDTQGFMGVWNNDIVVAFRGTERKLHDWVLTDGAAVKIANSRGLGKVHLGFKRAALAVYPKVKGFIERHRTYRSRVFLSGHSLGGALAVMTAAWLQNDRVEYRPRAVFTYGAPRIGDGQFARAYRRMRLSTKTHAWMVQGDPVPRVPRFKDGYRHSTTRHWRLRNDRAEIVKLDTIREHTQHEIDSLADIWKLVRGLSKEHSLKGAYLPRLRKLVKKVR